MSHADPCHLRHTEAEHGALAPAAFCLPRPTQLPWHLHDIILVHYLARRHCFLAHQNLPHSSCLAHFLLPKRFAAPSAHPIPLFTSFECVSTDLKSNRPLLDDCLCHQLADRQRSRIPEATSHFSDCAKSYRLRLHLSRCPEAENRRSPLGFLELPVEILRILESEKEGALA